MKIYIFADMEGISGVSRRAHVTVENDVPELYDAGCRMMEQDINACVAGCFDAGADAVVVRDGHGGGRNVKAENIDPRAVLFQGASPRVRYAEFAGCDALILLGYHAMAGTPRALLEHSYSSADYQNLCLNGMKAGELFFDAVIAAEHNVPVIMASGDDKTCAEAARFLPGVPFCQVKSSSGLQASETVPEAHELIRRCTAEAVRNMAAVKPVAITYPVTMRVEMKERLQRENRHGVYFPVPDDCRIYEQRGNCLEELFFDMI